MPLTPEDAIQMMDNLEELDAHLEAKELSSSHHYHLPN